MISQKNYFADIEGVATADPAESNSLIAWQDTWVEASTAERWGFSEDGVILSLEEGGAPRGDERAFMGDGTDTLGIDLLAEGAGVDSIKIANDAYVVPAYTIAETDDALVTSDATVWEAGVGVLVTAEYDAPAARSKKKEPREEAPKPKAKKKK